MVQLSPSPVLDHDVSPPPELSTEEGKQLQSSPNMGSPGGLSALQLALDDASGSTTYQGYDGYIEDGLICLKHKVRNLEKKKLKLEDYTKRLNQGEALNKDQMGAVEKYDEVIHNLAFAQDLHKTLADLTQNLLRDQKKAVKKEQVAKIELEQRRLGSVLQIQHLLHCLQEEHIRSDLLAGQNQAPHIPAPQLHSLTQLAALLGVKRDNNLSLQEQMEQSALAYLDLLEGKDKPVAGSTFKLMKQELDRLLDCKYFRCLPPPPSKTTEVFLSSPSLTNISKPKDISKKEFLNRLYLRDTETTPPQNWKEEFEAIKDREPPDSWELEFADASASPQAYGHKPWRGAATFVPKIPVTIKKHDGKRRSTKKAKGEHNAKTTMHIGTPVEVFNSPSALPKDPIQRKRQLEDLMTKIRTGSFSFMQESLLDGDGSPTNGHPRLGRRASGSPSPNAQRESTRSPVDILPTLMRSPVDILPTSMRSPVDILPTSMRSPVDILPTSMRSPVDILPTSMRSPVDIIPTSMRSPVDILPTSMRSPVDILPTSMRSPVDILPTAMHSTPRAACLVDQNASLTNGEASPVTCDLDLTTDELPDEALQLPDAEPAFSTPPLYRRESTISVSLEEKSRPRTPVSESGKQSPCNGVVPCSTPPQNQGFSTPPTRRSLTSTPFQNIHSVFKVNAPLPPNGDLSYKVDSGVFSETRYSTASTQTPPEFVLPEDQPETVYQSDYTVGNGVQLFLSPGQSGGGAGRTGQAYYTRGSVRGMARGGGKGLAHNFRTPGWYRGGAFIHQAHLRDSGPLLYGARDPGYQHGYRRGGGSGGARHNSSAGWSDSSQVSSPDREGLYTVVDSGHGDSSVSTLEVSVTPHSHHHATLMPMQLYPVSQPMRVAFTASRTANYAPGNLDQPIVFDQLHSNLGEMYDPHMGRFTCPANGTYVFLFHILKLAINVPLYINLMRNEEVMVSAYANDGAPDHETASNHAILPLYQGDQVWLRLHRGAIYGSTWKYSTFSGFMLYQD